MHMRFEPSGFTGNPEIPIAKSIMDYIFRWMDLKFGSNAVQAKAEPSVTRVARTEVAKETAAVEAMDEDSVSREEMVYSTQADAPPCHECGEIMVRSGACYKCFNCGATSGCS